MKSEVFLNIVFCIQLNIINIIFTYLTMALLKHVLKIMQVIFLINFEFIKISAGRFRMGNKTKSFHFKFDWTLA